MTPDNQTGQSNVDKPSICPECGQPGPHYVEVPDPGFFSGIGGFWTCDKFYGPDGRRIDPDPRI